MLSGFWSVLIGLVFRTTAQYSIVPEPKIYRDTSLVPSRIAWEGILRAVASSRRACPATTLRRFRVSD